jgi:hypothetical protein
MYLLRSHKTAHSVRSPLWLAVGIVLGAALGSTAGWAGDTKTEVRVESGHTIIHVDVDAGICNRCEIQGQFVNQLKRFHATIEIVELKKGVGIFYTAGKERDVHELQHLVEEAIEGIEEINDDPEEVHLCEFCLADFPVYSKRHYEILETSQGAMLLITSNDPEIVRSIKKTFRVDRSRGYREQNFGEKEKEQANKDK